MRQRLLLELLTRPHGSLIRTLLDAVPVGASAALDGRIKYANEVCAAMWGYAAPGEMHDVSFFTLIAPESRPFVERLWHARSGQAEHAWVCELVGLRPNGEPFPYRCSSLSFDIPNTGKATVAFFEDLSKERPAEECLRRRCADLLTELGE